MLTYLIGKFLTTHEERYMTANGRPLGIYKLIKIGLKFITLFKLITMLCGINNISWKIPNSLYMGIFHGILLVTKHCYGYD